MRLLFVHFGPFDSNSAMHTFHFGNLLSERGFDVTMCAVGDPARVRRLGDPAFECIGYSDLRGKLREYRKSPQETLVCGWTPRELVRRAVAPFAERLEVPYVVHLEDNEEYLLSSSAGMPIERLRLLPEEELDRLVSGSFSHPRRYLEFLAASAGITVITEELNEFNPNGRPHHLARPGIDAVDFRPDLEPAVPRSSLGLADDDFVLVYHGTVHYANQHEMLSLYLAVKLLQRDGLAVKLVRLGETGIGGPDPRTFRALMEGVVELGAVPWREVPRYLALADAYVQPGAADDFNRYRLPSKLPEFLAMGRPVVLPHCNIGNELTHGENALLLEQGTATEIAARVAELEADPALARRLGAGAREFALANLDWAANADALAGFYRSVMAGHREREAIASG